MAWRLGLPGPGQRAIGKVCRSSRMARSSSRPEARSARILLGRPGACPPPERGRVTAFRRRISG